MKKIWIYDLETLDIFAATFMDRDSDDTKVFVISKNKDERNLLFNFLENKVAGLVGYNCITFDSQILEYLYRYPECTAKDIANYAQIITNNNDRIPDVPEWKLKIKHLDLFRALSLSVKAKRVGLKWCEYSMNLDNIEDMPSQGTGDNWEQQVLAYNLNDVIATKELYIRYKSEIELRQTISKREGVNVLNSTEPDISKKLFLHWLSKAMNISQNDLRNMGTDREWVNVKNIIFPYIKFKTPLLQQIKKDFEGLHLHPGSKFEKEIIFGGIKTVFGLGGLHGSVKNKLIKSDNIHIIKSLDVISYYPNLAIRNKLHPTHIPQEIFCNLYEGLFNERRSVPKSDPRNYILKICLNALYGLTNDKYSFLRDRQFTVAICVNGQLLLAILFEKLLLEIPNSKLIMINTDGAEILIPIEYQEKYFEICKQWEKLTKLELEFIDYKQIIIWDVNNYISETYENKTKCKGKIEFKDIPLHKNRSHNIIPIAVYNYFIKNIPIEDTIYNHRNIFDFCAGVKASKSGIKGISWYELHSIDRENLIKEKLSKTVRYFISKKGKYLMKCCEDNSISHVEAPMKINKSRIKEWRVTYFNKKFNVENFEDYNIDYSYYISHAREWITSIEDKQQLTLF
jgi:hypothetical protein